jgi:hypothetical protein
MQDPVKFREYADECKKLAQTASGENRAALLRIAKAWITCAEDVERDRRRPDRDAGPGAADRSGRDVGVKGKGGD